jgi:hypothetical protein
LTFAYEKFCFLNSAPPLKKGKEQKNERRQDHVRATYYYITIFLKSQEQFLKKIFSKKLLEEKNS